jgi:GAF domain-containing protein/HAMP domain-containing protein
LLVFLAILTIGIAIGLGIFISRSITVPVGQLTQAASEIAGGNLEVRAPSGTTDEVGILAGAFNSMTTQLRDLVGSLEQRIAERTQNLELAAEVGRSVSQVRDLDEMLRDACELIREEFDLYYVQVYLADPRQTTLQLQAGTGAVGAQLLERKHRLQLNTGSINGRAAVEKRTVVISDAAESATFRPNPLLPDTRGEMAVPLIVGENVVGVLDMQSSQPGILNEEVLPAFEALAGQLAVAIQNANLVAEAQKARAEVEAQARRLVRTGWGEYLDALHKPEQIGFVFDQSEITPLEEIEEIQLPDDSRAYSAPISLTGEMLGSLVVEWGEEKQTEQAGELVNIVARQVAQHIENLRLLESAERYRYEAEQSARRQTREGWQEYIDNRTSDSPGYLYDLNEVRPYSNGHESNEAALTLPLRVRDETIGKLVVDGLAPDDKDSLDLANAVAERLGAHIESLRQYDRTQSALAQSEKLFDASRLLTQATDLQELVAATVNTLDISEVNRAVLTTFDYDSAGNIEKLTIIANWWNETGHEVTPLGTRYPLEVIRVMPMFVSPTPVFFNDAFHDERVDATTLELVKRQNLRAVAVLPLHVGSQQIGALILEAEEPHDFTQDQIRLFTALAPQVATVLDNRQQYERAQRQAEREAMLNAINQKIQGATSVEAVLQIAARELGHALGAPMTIAQLSMKDRN